MNGGIVSPDLFTGSMEVSVLLFTDFEPFEQPGPVDIFSRLKDYHVNFYSVKGGSVRDEQGGLTDTLPLKNIIKGTDILLIAGGSGSRAQAAGPGLIDLLKSVSESSKYILTIGTGSALLAKTGLLNTRGAATDFREFDWIRDISEKIRWNRRALWTADDKYYTCSGMAGAGDMIRAFLTDRHGEKFTAKLSW